MAAARWRSLFHPLRNLSASSNGNTFHPASSDSKSFSDPKPQADIEEETSTPKPVSSSLIFEDVRASLRKPSQATPKMGLKLNGNESAGSFSLEAFGKSLRIQAEKGPGPVPRPRPSSLKRSDLLLRFARQPTRPPKLELMKMYSYDELGAKLRKLRPEDWKRFSLTELNDRLRKLREMEEEESKYSPGGLSFKVLRESLYQLRMSSETSKKKSSHVKEQFKELMKEYSFCTKGFNKEKVDELSDIHNVIVEASKSLANFVSKGSEMIDTLDTWLINLSNRTIPSEREIVTAVTKFRI